MGADNKRLYKALNVGLFIFVEDEFLFNDREGEVKPHVLIDFARMDVNDRNLLLSSISEETPGKKSLQDYADKAEYWTSNIDWSKVPLDDAERILEGQPDILALYQAVPETLWEGEYQQSFSRYGIGVVVQDVFKPLFREVIRALPNYIPTRIYQTYTEEIRQSIMHDLETCKKLGKSAVLILDNKVGDTRLAAQIIEDLKKRDKRISCPIYATIFSTAPKDFAGESCETPELYIGYANKTEKLDGVHKNIAKAAISSLIQQYKTKYKDVIDKNCDILAQNPDLVEYLYGMARAEGEPGYELLQQWISFMANHAMEQSDEMLRLMQLSGSIDAYEAKINWNLNVPKDLANAAHSENFSPTVNKFCTATAPGDIFEYKGNIYVLVGQDCDYMMGEKRNRNAPLCELVSAELVSQGDIDKLSDDRKYVYINNYMSNDGNVYVLKVNYGTRVVVCNEIINLCSFNQNGYCRIDCSSELPEDVSALLQPYMLEYYKKLIDFFKQLKQVNTAFPDFYRIANMLKTVKPLIDISSYDEHDNVLDYGIRRISRLKKTASLYLYKMFLEYRGRMPYTTVNLTGYSIVTATIEGDEKSYQTDVHIKLTSKREKNRKDQAKLTWYVSRHVLQKALDEIIGGDLTLDAGDEYIELQGKGKVRLNYGDDHIILQKYIDDDKYFIKVEFERRDEA